MATIRIDLTAENRASREVLNLRSEVNKLGRQIAENNVIAAKGTLEERRAIAEKNRSIRASQGLLRVEQQRQSIQLANLRQINRESRQASGGMNLLARAGQSAVGTFGAFIALDAVHYLSEFARGSVTAAVRVEGFRNSLTALYGDAQVAARVLEDLRELAQDPGITFEGAVRGAVRLKTVGIEGERSLSIIREWGNAAALSGASADEMNRSIIGLTQAVARGTLDQENWNQVTENVPLIAAAAREAFNSIDAEVIREQLAAAGQDVNDFIDILTNQLASGARASADSAANAFSNFNNAVFELQSTLGERFLPTITSVTRGLTGFIELVSGGIEQTKDFTQTVAELSASDLRTSLLNVNSELERNQQRYQDLIEKGANPAHASMQQLDRIIKNLEGDSARLSEQLGTLTQGITAVEPPTTQLRTATQDLSTIIRDIDTRFLSFRERGDVLSGTIRELPPAITEVFGAFQSVSPLAEQAAQQFDTLNTSLVESQREARALATIYTDLQIATNALNDTTDAQVASGNRVDPVLRQQTLATREYAGELSNLDVAYQGIDEITKNVITSSRNQIQTITDLTQGFKAAEIATIDFNDALDDLDQEIQADAVGGLAGQLQQVIDNDPVGVLDSMIAGIANIDLETRDATDSLLDMTSAFLSLVEGNPFPILAESAATLVTVIEGLVNRDFGGPLGLPPDFFDDPVGRQGRVNPQNRVRAAQLEQEQTHHAGIARYLNTPDPLAQIELLRENDPGIFQRFNTRAFIEQNFPELVDVIYPSGQGFNLSGALTRQDRARATAEATGTDRQATEDVAREMYGAGYEAGIMDAEAALTDTSLAENALQRAQFGLGDATSEQDFEDRRQNLIRLTNEYYDLESKRIGELGLEETELRDQREDNELARLQALRRARDATNTFAEDRIRAEERAARETERLTAETTREQERAAREAEREAERTASEREREAARIARETQRSEARAAQTTVNLSGNVRDRAVFALGLATDETDFETRRQTAIDATNDYYDAESARIDGLMLSEGELQDLREDNELAREVAIKRLTDQENTFTQERIRNEERVAREAERTAQEAERETERQRRERERETAQAEREAERQRRETERETEREAREEARQLRETERERERVAAEAERQRRSGIAGASALDLNRVERARFALGASGSEAEFETRRRTLIRVTNEYYDNELKRIEELGGSELELQNAREDTELERQRALRRARNETNQFAEDRIREEERVAAETERIQERADADRLREAERLQDEIADLRADQIENEADRLADLEDLQKDHNRRILELEEELTEDLDDLRRERNRTGEDILRDYQRDLEDLQTETARRLFGEEFGDLTEGQRSRLAEDDTFQRELFDLNRQRNRAAQDFQTDFGILTPGSPGYDFYRQQLEGGDLTDTNLIERLFGRQGLDDFTSSQRDIEDAEQRRTQRETDIIAEAEAQAVALTEALQPLITQNTATAETQATTVATEAETVATLAPAVDTFSESTAELANVDFPAWNTAIEDFMELPGELVEAFAFPDELIAQSVSIMASGAVRVSAENVTVQGRNVRGGGQGAETPTRINAVLTLPSGKVIAEALLEDGVGVSVLENTMAGRADDGLSNAEV